jgi:ankyrin repeat protein
MTPLLYAVREDNREIVKLLLASGAQINQPDANGTTALLLALIDGHIDLAQFLLERGADINSADGYGRTPLFSAIDARDAGFYANPYAGTNETNPLDVIKVLLDRGAHPDVRTRAVVPNRGWQQTDGSWVNFTGQTPFLRAAFAGDVTVMRLLIAHGANPNLATNDGTTPLMAAAGVNYVVGRTFTHPRVDTLEAVKLCLETGADVNAQNSLGFTAAHGAANRGLDDVLRLLAEHGANLAAKDKEGRTPLTFAEGVFLAVTPPAAKPETAKLIGELIQRYDSKAQR